MAAISVVSRGRRAPGAPHALLEVITAAALAWPVGASASPIESAVDVAGVVGAVSLGYGQHTLGAALASAVETDRFTFTAAAGDSFMLRLRSFTGGLDPLLTLRDPMGVVLATTFCDGFSGGVCSAALSHVAMGSGLYTLNVGDAGVNESGRYQMHLDRYPPRNNWAGVRYSEPKTESLGHTTDIDYFGFDGVAGSRVQFSLQTLTGGLDAQVRIWAPDGTLALNRFCDGFSGGVCSVSQELLMSTTGLYRIGIDDFGLDEGGNYRFQLDCAFGACPSPLDPAPVPVPEPATWALLLLGLGAVAARARRVEPAPQPGGRAPATA
jgi:hypothetical protein